jgi:hypothetical protein
VGEVYVHIAIGNRLLLILLEGMPARDAFIQIVRELAAPEVLCPLDLADRMRRVKSNKAECQGSRNVPFSAK